MPALCTYVKGTAASGASTKPKKQMKKLLHTLLLSAIALSTLSLGSCLTDDNDTKTVTYSDCAITSFSLGSLKRTFHTTSKSGKDSSYVASYTPTVSFTIDQYRHEIYNNDSLPEGTDSTKVLLNVSTRNGGYVYVKSTTSDSIFYHNSTDSIDFTTNPRQLCVISTDGTSSVLYKVKINIHKELPQKMTWNAPYTAEALKDGVQSIAEQGNSLFVKSGSAICSTAINGGKTWSSLSGGDSASGIASHNGYIYSTDGKGNLIRTTDCTNWETVSTTAPLGISKVLGSSAGKLYAIANDAAGNSPLVSIDTETGTATPEEFYDPATANYAANASSICEAQNGQGTTIICNITNADDSHSTYVLYKAENTATPQKWMILSNTYDQNLPDNYTEAVSYGKYLVALSGGKFYTSLDHGRSWQNRYFLYAPSALSKDAVSHIYADSHGILWIFAPNGQVFTGKLNEMAW